MRYIGRYKIRGLLGSGGMGRVYKVELPSIKKISALKLLNPDPLLAKLMGRETLLHMFIQEAGTMARLQHPHIVSVNDFESGPEGTFYIMDYLPNNLGVVMGETFKVEAPTRKLEIDTALNYTRQILEGLACLHHADIIHRDIKPFNLLITSQDHIKICDFGMSKLHGERYTGPKNLNVGSPYYAAPEQTRSPDGVSATADLYAVGTILYRMLTGQLPQTASVPASRIHYDLDYRWDEFIATAIKEDPQERFPDADTMLDHLNDLTTYWHNRKERACRLQTEEPPPERNQHVRVEKTGLRSRPEKIPQKTALKKFELDDLWRPQRFASTQFSAVADGVVQDLNHGLAWQQAGSRFPVTWQQASTYVEKLNERREGGRYHWRLPTVEELMTLVRPKSENRSHCIPSLFETRQQRIWSCDRSSFIAAYFIDTIHGFIGEQDFSAPCYVRAVCEEIRSAM